MILGVGTDIVLVERIERWKDFSYDQLRRIFSKYELDDCRLQAGSTRREGRYNFTRLATRFAAKEAFFKAISRALVKLELTEREFSLFFLCGHVSVEKTMWDVPVLKVNWDAIQEKIGAKLPPMDVEISISHEQRYVVAYVVLFPARDSSSNR